MKLNRIYKFFILLVTFISLSACGEGAPTLDERLENNVSDIEKVTYTGIIQPLELDIYQEGTHQLETEDNQIIIIQSQTFNLNRYLEKAVTVKGEFSQNIGNSQSVLNIDSVMVKQEVPGELRVYENKIFGLKFNYSNTWELIEENQKIILHTNNYNWVTIDIINTPLDLEAFLKNREVENGTPITISTQKSIRYIQDESIRIYIPNPSKNKIYLVVFNVEKRKDNDQKNLFYDFLESFTPLYFKKQQGKKCGGIKDLKCPESFRCELESGELKAEGICVSLDVSDNALACPYIAVPTNCDNYQVKNFNKDGCPTSYECLDILDDNNTDSGYQDNEDDIDTTQLIDVFIKNQAQVLQVKNAQIIQFEISESSLIAAVYNIDSKKYKKLFSYAAMDSEFNFIEKAHFEEGEKRDWDLISGQNLQTNLAKKIIKINQENKHIANEVSENMRLYENKHKNFSIQYYKNWYFRSFGATKDAIWLVGFGDKPLENISDAIVTIKILPGVIQHSATEEDSQYRITKKRDKESYFAIEGPLEWKEVIEQMGETLK